MSSLTQRITKLSPEKRKLLEQLTEQRKLRRQIDEGFAEPRQSASSTDGASAALSPLEIESEAVIGPLTLEPNSRASQVKLDIRSFYNGVNDQLNSTEFGKFSFFLNYGYVPDHNPQVSQVKLPDHYINKNSVRLVLELIGDCDIAARRVLDVGCGRGGTIHVINKFFSPESTVGVDLSSAAIAFCKKNHRYAGVSFYEVDAEQLPFPDQSFDIVTNVESSHSYPNIHSFYQGVYRVLKPGGYFLYTDVMRESHLNEHVAYLQDNGFILDREQDITSNVLLSCDEIARARGQAFDSRADPETMSEFLAMPGSESYDLMNTGLMRYKIFRFRKN